MKKTSKTSPFLKGTVIRFKENGTYSYYKITDDYTTWHQGVNYDTLPKGTIIHTCVWKDRGTRLEERSVSRKLTAPTKTQAQWAAECKKLYDEQMAYQQRQLEFLKELDALSANVSANEIVSLLFGKLPK